jgi:hypothetical protein
LALGVFGRNALGKKIFPKRSMEKRRDLGWRRDLRIAEVRRRNACEQECGVDATAKRVKRKIELAALDHEAAQLATGDAQWKRVKLRGVQPLHLGRRGGRTVGLNVSRGVAF